jgi:hypothetical protein
MHTLCALRQSTERPVFENGKREEGAVKTVDQLRVAHEKAMEACRLLEVEQREIPCRIEHARSGANIVEVGSLSQRKRELPELLRAASERERAAYTTYIRAKTPDPRKAEMIIRLAGG